MCILHKAKQKNDDFRSPMVCTGPLVRYPIGPIWKMKPLRVLALKVQGIT